MSTQTKTPEATHGWPVPARIGAAGIATFFAASIVTAALTPGYRSTRDQISALAALDSPYAGIMIAGFLAAAVGLVSAGVGLARRYGATLSGRIAAGLVTVAGALTVVAGLARQDCSQALPSCVDHGDGALASNSFWIHQYASLLLFLLLVSASFVLIRAVRRTEGFGFLTVAARIVAYGTLALTVAMVVVGFGDQDGLVQRPYLAVLFGWPILAAAIAPRR
ncbi:DUF998 domain-containing protein [Actinoplanes sp. M2I2]|uniref:DUF998 domain-containing protein n=1 Tax=Actinoplanes sp. M2I2 TaxID=1734444 RepID=UPI00202183EF|nr:DUF998 domain-containing protein [Actinoplanes sp. M2I2]